MEFCVVVPHSRAFARSFARSCVCRHPGAAATAAAASEDAGFRQSEASVDPDWSQYEAGAERGIFTSGSGEVSRQGRAVAYHERVAMRGTEAGFVVDGDGVHEGRLNLPVLH